MIKLDLILSNIEEIYNIKESTNDELKKNYFLSNLYECSKKYKNEEYNILIGIKNDFPLSAPEIFWKDFENNFLPHIEEINGKICYLEEDLYTFDYENIEGIISSCIDMAIEHIYNGKHGLNSDDFINEFNSYWVRTGQTINVDSYIKITENIRLIKAYIEDKNFLVYDEKTDLNYALKQCNKDIQEECIQEAIYIPLENNIGIFPPKHQKAWSIGEIRNIILKNLSRVKVKQLTAILRKNKSTKVVIISFPNKNGERVVIGVGCYDFHKILKGKFLHPIITGFINCKITLLNINRKDKNYLLNRGGAIDCILKKRILVIGCGSLGSHIIEQLVNVGISNITIIDKDKFLIQNIYRHVLGYNNLKREGSYKSEEMKIYLEEKYRGVKINSIAYDVIDCIEDGSLNLEEFDLIIVAIGNPNIEFNLNKKVQALLKKIPTIFTWNEPNGIGGHVLVSNNATTGGCYECLYTNIKTGERTLKNKASLVDSSENYIKKYGGCGSAYLPYSYLDSEQTAILCSRTVLEIFTEKEKGNPIKTWKGKNHYNIKTTKRYDLTESEIEATQYMYINPKCKVCGEVKSDI